MWTIIVIIATVCLFFHEIGRQDDKCGVFSKNSNVRDTVILRATYIGLVELPQGHKPLVYLEQKGQLKASNFKSSIVFKPENCDTEYNLVCGDNTFEGKRVFKGHPQRIISLTCVVFRDPKIPMYAQEPFVIVSKVKREK